RVPGVQQIRLVGAGVLGCDHLVRSRPAIPRGTRPDLDRHRTRGAASRPRRVRATVGPEAGGAPMTGRRAVSRLGALESQVMDLLWDQGPSTIRGLIDRLPGDP